jgi:hypothetical protein
METIAPETITVATEDPTLVTEPIVPESVTVVTEDPNLVTETISPETVTTVTEAPSVTTSEGGVVELQQPAINADGDRAVSTGVNPVADGTGETIYVGDIDTGGIQGQTIIYEEPSLNVSGNTSAPAPAPAPTSSEPVRVIYSDPAPAPAPATVAGEPVYTGTATTFTETTTTVIEMNPGNGQARG